MGVQLDPGGIARRLGRRPPQREARGRPGRPPRRRL